MENKSVTSHSDKEKNVYSNLIKWGLILLLVLFVAIKNREFVESATKEIEKTSKSEIIWCIVLSNLYFVFEALILMLMTKTSGKCIGFFKGLVCGYMCAFYRVATLGSGNGIAQLYYFNINGIDVSNGTGIALSQYTIQKITIGVFGILAYAGVLGMGDDRVQKYSKYMLLGTVVITLICAFLIIITVSKTISDMLIRLGRRIIKQTSKLYSKLDKAEESIRCLQAQGRKIWKNKLLFFKVMALDFLKFSCWYAIPGILLMDDFDVELIMCLLLMAICNMIGCVMVAPSGVGTLEFVFAIFFSAIVPKKRAIAATILIYRFFTWIVPFVIGIIPAITVKKKTT